MVTVVNRTAEKRPLTTAHAKDLGTRASAAIMSCRHIEYENATHGCVSAVAFVKPFVVCINHLSEPSCVHTDSDGFTKHVWKPKQPVPLQFEAVTVQGERYTDLAELRIKYTECDPQEESWTGTFGDESLTLTKPNWEALRADVAHASTLATESQEETKRLKALHRNLVEKLQQKCSIKPNDHVFAKRNKHDDFETCSRCGYKEHLWRV